MEGGVSQQPRPPASQFANLIRSEQVSRLPHLNPQQKQQTEARVQKLWEIINSNTGNQSDPKFQQAYQNLGQLSGQLMQGMRAFNMRKQQAAQGQAQGQGQGQGQAPQQSQPNQNQSQQPNGAAPQAQGGSNSVQFSQLLPDIQAKVNAQHFYFPPAMTEGSKAADDWLKEAKARFGQAIQRAQMARNKKNELQKMAQQRQQSGNPLTQDEQNGLSAKIAQCNKAMQESQNFMDKFREQQEQFKNAMPQHRFAHQTGGAPSAPGRPDGTADGSAAAAAGGGGSQIAANTQGGPQAHSIKSAQTAARASSQGAADAGAAGTSQPQSSGPQSTPVDAAQTPFNAQGAVMNQQQQQGAPQSAVSRPSTATGAPPGAIHPSASMQNQATHAHPVSAGAGGPHSLNTVNGMKTHPAPIPKTLSVTEPKPINMPPSRPTLNGGAGVGLPGQLAQPALTVFPGYVLEQSEDGHLLSKKKLNELVREVMGPNSEDQLSPEAEEVCLQVVDDFIDDVIAAGCRLAKLRGASSLEARDVQVVLERQYNIRIPGFSTDEVRTVRKVQPSPGWTHKMGAVQAAKLTGGGGVGVNGA